MSLFSQPFPQPFPFSATVPKKISQFFVVAFIENKYLCSVKRKNDFSNRSIPTQNKE